MSKPTKRWGESDEDYSRRMTRESNERVIELSTGTQPSKGWLESDEEYASRIEIQANECDIASSSGTAPIRGILESREDYARRVAKEADEAVLEEHDGSRPYKGWVESDSEFKRRIRLKADEAVVERESGSAPYRRFGEDADEYRGRVRQEARALLAGKEAPTKDSSNNLSGEAGSTYDSDSPESYGGSGTGESAAGGLIAVFVIVAIAALLFHLTQGRQQSDVGSPSSVTTAFVNAPGLNVRSGPGRSEPVLTTLSRGEEVQVLDGGGGDWARVRTHGVEGWVRNRYLAARADAGGGPGTGTSPAGAVTGPVRITLQFQDPADHRPVEGGYAALKEQSGWRVGSPEHVLPAGENRPETYGGVRYFFVEDSVLARTVCNEVVGELARRGFSVIMPLWPMVTRQRLGLFQARPGLIEVWISPLPEPVPAGNSAAGQCGR